MQVKQISLDFLLLFYQEKSKNIQFRQSSGQTPNYQTFIKKKGTNIQFRQSSGPTPNYQTFIKEKGTNIQFKQITRVNANSPQRKYPTK